MKKDAYMRMVADAVMLNGAVFLGYLTSYGVRSSGILDPIQMTFPEFIKDRVPSILLMNVIAIAVFYVFGMYTKGRAYRGRYKALVVFQAVTAAFVLFGFVSFMAGKIFPMSSFTWLVSYAVGGSLIVGARVWMNVLRTLAANENVDLVATDLERVASKSVVVFGGAGYIGSALLRKLLNRGYRVRLVDAFMFGEEPIADMLSHPNLEIVRADFRQIDRIIESMYGMDAVVHMGAIVGDPACALDEDFTLEVNLMATRMIAECAKGFGIRKFIFASTCSVYGASDEHLNEKSKLNPVSLYARSKIACERILLEMTDDKFRPTILRFGTVYGLSGRTRFDLVVNLLTAKAIVDGKITVFGEDQWRPFVHVDDAALAVATALDSRIEVVGGETFNVGSEEGNMTLGQVGRLIQRFVPTAELIASGSDGDRRNYRVDFSKIKNKMGFKPQWSVEQGVKQVIEAFESGKVVDYNSAKYSNVKYLTEEAQKHGLHKDSLRMKRLVEESVDQIAIFK